MSAASREGSGAMFDAIAARYDLLNRVISLGLDRSWRRRLLGALEAVPLARVVDVATGTADVALDIARRHPTAEVVGVDPSAGMLGVGRRKALSAGVAERLHLLRGDGRALPLPDGWADACCIAFGIRNVPDRQAALAEMRRVTRPGGVLAVLELGEPRRGLLAPFARLHVRRVVPWLGACLSGAREYRYLASSVQAFPPPGEFLALLAGAGWGAPVCRPMPFDAAHLYVGRA